MITALHIQDFVLIDQARLSLAKGLTALTGETGAGKSILLDALGLAAGGRADRGAVRAGAKQGTVSAAFEPPADHPVWHKLEENGLDNGDDQIILRRTQTTDGRGRGFVNDQPVSIGMLREIGEALLEIHGQHDGRGFLTASAHRGMLDEFGGLQKKAKQTSDLWRKWRDAEDALTEKKRDREATIREADYLRHVVKTLEKLAPQSGEEALLASRRTELMAAEKISEDLNAAASALDDNRLEKSLSSALRSLERAAARAPESGKELEVAAERLEAAIQEFGEAQNLIAVAVGRFGGNPDELDETEERLFALRAEARKHGVAPDDLLAFLTATSKALDDLELGEAAFSDLEKAAQESEAAFHKAAAVLSKGRHAAAKKLDSAVAKELAPLKLGKAIFQTEINSDEAKPTTDGIDTVEFMVATNPGAPAGPLKSIASGGELSRFVLAMKAALAAKENRTVIIFDEVDAGVGGAVADAVGERLSRLAMDAQVLVVTHSPQVAARANNHFRIEKTQLKQSTTVSVNALTKKERTEEIARMLSGAEISKEARAAAQRLLDGNASPANGRSKAVRNKVAKAS